MEEFTYPEMTLDLRVYLDHQAGYQNSTDHAAHREKTEMLSKLLPEGLLGRYHQAKKIWMCRDATQTSDPTIHTSPSGKYKLHITRHTTGPNSWTYSKGKIYRDSELIAEVFRNYSAFPFLFVEGHPKGDFLISGEDYQGQTVIELGTEKRRDNLSKGTDKGHGFCWAEYRYDEKSEILVVCGCHWACPYEFRFYDFSNPMKGWPELETESCVDEDVKWPIIEDGKIRCFETGLEDEDAEEEESVPRIEKAIKTFRREGNKLLLLDEWVSEAEKERRQKAEEASRRYEAWKADFRANDPLYLTYKSRLNDPGLNPESYESVGVTYPDWCPDFKEHESRWCRRIVKKGKSYTIDLEWGVKTGPIKLVIYKNGKHIEDKWFEHSVEGMNEAFTSAQALMGGVP